MKVVDRQNIPNKQQQILKRTFSVNNRLSIFVAIVCICFSLFFTNEVKAQNVSVWDGTMAAWTHGNGTQANPYLIESAQQLVFCNI